MKTFVTITVNKNTFNSYFNTVKALNFREAEDAVNFLNNSNNFVRVVPTTCIREIVNTFNKASDWKF